MIFKTSTTILGVENGPLVNVTFMMPTDDDRRPSFRPYAIAIVGIASPNTNLRLHNNNMIFGDGE